MTISRTRSNSRTFTPSAALLLIVRLGNSRTSPRVFVSRVRSSVSGSSQEQTLHRILYFGTGLFFVIFFQLMRYVLSLSNRFVVAQRLFFVPIQLVCVEFLSGPVSPYGLLSVPKQYRSPMPPGHACHVPCRRPDPNITWCPRISGPQTCSKTLQHYPGCAAAARACLAGP